MSVDTPVKNLEKIPPQNIEAEMATLGAMLIDEKVVLEGYHTEEEIRKFLKN